MHAHIGKIESALRSLERIETAFWGGRYPEWTRLAETRKHTEYEYVFAFERAMPDEDERRASAKASFTWTARVDWVREAVPRHDFEIGFSIGDASVIERLLLKDPSATLLHDESAILADTPVMARWRGAYREALALLGIEVPPTFDRPDRAVETFYVPMADATGVPRYAERLGRLLLDELCAVPLAPGA